MKQQSKLILKGVSDNGIPFKKEIHTLDEVKSSGNYVVICKNASSYNGLPQIDGKNHLCFCCEAQLSITCCYSEDEAQSNTAYGQKLTICDRETGTTNTYTRTISPGKNDGKWSEWQMAAIGDIELVSANNEVVETLNTISNDLTTVKSKCELSDTLHSISTARHFNYTGNYPFSQKVIDAGIDKMIISGYLDIEYEEGVSYSFAIASKTSNLLELYKKTKDVSITNSELTYIYTFVVTKINGSPYYLAKCASSPLSWFIVDWDNIKTIDNIYDYDGVALSPSLFKNSGLSSRIEDVDKLRKNGELFISNELNLLRGDLNNICYKVIDYDKSVIANLFQISNEVGEPLFSSSIFSGAGMYVGELAPFRYILSYFKCSDWVSSPKPITKILLQIRENTHEGNILHTQTVSVNITPGNIAPVIFDLGEIKTFTGNLYIALRADSYGTPMRPADSNYPFEPTDGVAFPHSYWWAYGNIEESNIGFSNSYNNGQNFYFQTFSEINLQPFLTDRIVNDIGTRLNLNLGVEISLPDKIVAVVGDTLQLFYQGMIKAVNPYNYNILVSCDKGKQAPRYFEYTPTSSDIGTTNFTICVKGNNGETIISKSCKLQTVAIPKSPASVKRVLCFGDSNTAGGEWVKETYRRLTATDGIPMGAGLSNIEFCGSKNGNGAGWFGVGGWTWGSYTSAGKPAFRFHVTDVDSISVGAVYSHNGYSYTVVEVNISNNMGNILCETSSQSNTPLESGVLTKTSGNGAGSITFTSFEVDARNPLWDIAQGKMSFIPYANEVAGGQIDVVYTNLTWNGVSANMTDFSAIISQMKIFADTLHTEFPNAKLKLMGQNPPSLCGGMGANYGATGTSYADTYGMFKTILNMNDAYQEFANSEEYSDFVEFVNVSSQFDVENNMQSAEFSVNTRNSKKERLGTNGVHPANEGYMQIADVVFRNFVANFCQ